MLPERQGTVPPLPMRKMVQSPLPGRSRGQFYGFPVFVVGWGCPAAGDGPFRGAAPVEGLATGLLTGFEAGDCGPDCCGFCWLMSNSFSERTMWPSHDDLIHPIVCPPVPLAVLR